MQDYLLSCSIMPYPFGSNRDSDIASKKLKMQIETLRVHADVCRMKLSKTIKELIEYCEAHKHEDPLVANPFKDTKMKCTIL